MDFTFTVEVVWFLIVIGWLGVTTRCYIVWHTRTHSLAFIQDFESVGNKDVHGGVMLVGGCTNVQVGEV